MEHPVSDLSPEARALLAAAADGDDPSPADRDRVARAIAVPLGITALVPATAQAAGGALGAATGLSVAKVVTATVVVLGLGGGAWVKARRERYDAGRATVAGGEARASARVPRATPPPAATPQAAPPPPTSEETLRVTAPSAPPPAEARPLPRLARPEAASAGSLRAESELIAAAHRALLGGDPSAALARIADYDARFPRGALREERDLERVLALCAAGRGAESRAAARRFLRSFPDSPSVGRAARACAETNPSRDEGAAGTETPSAAPGAPSRAE